MGNALKLALVVGGIYVALTLYLEGPRQAFGGALSFLASDEEYATEVLDQTYLYTDADRAKPGPKKVLITDAVRSRVGNAMKKSGARQVGAENRSGI